MKKIYVLDTNVLIHDPESIFKFEDNDIVLPLTVIEELDGLKKGHGEIAYSARQALKIIDTCRERGDISQGIPCASGGTIRVRYVPGDDRLSADNRIIRTAIHILRESRETSTAPALALHGAGAATAADIAPVLQPVVLVSKDTAVRIKAESLGLTAEDYRNDKTSLFQQ